MKTNYKQIIIWTIGKLLKKSQWVSYRISIVIWQKCRSDNFRENRVRLVRVELNNMNKDLLNFLLLVLCNAVKSADWMKLMFKNQSINSDSLLGEQNEGQNWTQHALKPLILSTKPITLRFAKKLPTLKIHHKAKPDPEPTLPEGLLPDLPDPSLQMLAQVLRM